MTEDQSYVKAVGELERLRQRVAELEKENNRLHDIEARMKAADNDATKFAIEASDLRQLVAELEVALDEQFVAFNKQFKDA